MLEIRERYEEKKPAVLCLAGNLFSPKVFDGIHAPDGMQKIYIDYLQNSGPWDMETLGWGLLDVIGQMKLEKVILAGYSAGGVIALSAAAKAPEKIDGLMLSNTGPCSIGHGSPQFAEELKERFEDREYICEFLSRCFYKPVDGELLEMFWQYTRKIPKKAAYEVSKSLREVDYREDLRRYKNPVSIAHGILDTRRKKDSVQIMKSCMPQAEITFLQTGHTPMLEDSAGYQRCLDLLAEKVMG